jgi:NADH dehydrogenase
VGKILHVSTIAVKFRDQRYYHYAQAKKEAEELVAGSGLRYVIVRPTMILGKASPVLESLTRLAAAPRTPIFGDGRSVVQPIGVADLAQIMAAIVEQDGFTNEVIELGGPERLTIEDLLGRISRIVHGREPRPVHLPVKLLARMLAAVEPLFLPLMPVTAGQLASFTNDGAAASNFWLDRSINCMKNVDEILRATNV